MLEVVYSSVGQVAGQLQYGQLLMHVCCNNSFLSERKTSVTEISLRMKWRFGAREHMTAKHILPTIDILQLDFMAPAQTMISYCW